MKKIGIINSELSRLVSELGHTDTIVIADCGLPIPPGVKRIDLALRRGVPGFLETLQTILEEMQVQRYTVADEMKQESPEMFDERRTRWMMQKCISSAMRSSKYYRVKLKRSFARVNVQLTLTSFCMQGLRSNEEGVQKMTAQLLEMKAIDKSFSEVKVLQQAQFSLESGEVHVDGEERRREIDIDENIKRHLCEGRRNGDREGIRAGAFYPVGRAAARNHHDSSGAEPDSAFDRDGEHLPRPGIYVRTNEAD